ncbi:hypothetical protein HBI55_120990 [Parastagonospora nodorum]|nr:hypothetical protein HBI09_132500 [Parastagonospora nodorum]KAH4198100.1 hypothetical protein HBI95_184440 [Parastagonospora nodorum]KAH5001511.1 hypothetical protein HBI77_145550 [Parastagonospora nodorum]KAH5111915.1 hypothetical protein HBH71_166230 [Parastagonospora nodorum]KAH6115853.1 hypothetical protein HBI69_116170 [Parastagonospora nodorum]
MYFLATPHRGSDLARTLNSILRTTATYTTRAYISNLSGQNELLALLDDSFRHYALDISLYSFYESRPTEFHVHSEVIVPKASAVIGYPHERYAMLDADHRHVCKFESPSDPNYGAVLHALRTNVDGIVSKRYAETREEMQQAMQQIESYLAMPARPDDDLKDLEECRIDGSCEWFAGRDAFQKWVDPESDNSSMVYWISANPATGKSVLSSFVVNSLESLNLDCSYYFFRHGDKDKSTVSGFLRSLLCQMALRNAEVRRHLLTMIENTQRYNKDDAKTIWWKLVVPIISRASIPMVQYWVLDALDECHGFEQLFTFIASMEPKTFIRILITSRKLPEITQNFEDLSRAKNAPAVAAEEISLDDTKADIRLYLEGNRHKLHFGDDEEKAMFIDSILVKSEGCFLWVRLVLDELALAWSVQDVQRILDEVPRDMDPLYARALGIMSARTASNRSLISAILTWVICSVRPLTVSELREALILDLDEEIPELEKAIATLCAQLIHVDKNGRALIVHLTAKTFLTDEKLESEFRVDTKDGHTRLAVCCLDFLSSEQMKVTRGRRLRRKPTQPTVIDSRSPFIRYASLEYAEHLRLTTSVIPAVSRGLYSFLDENILSWIEFVATTGNLSVLTRTANSINAYVQRHIQSSSPLGEFVFLTQNWAVDLHRIVTGFGPNLLAYPGAIYWLIPPFCPRSSAIATATASRFGRISVKGVKNEGWNDRMTCIDSHNQQVSAVASGDTIFAIGYSSGTIVLHHNSTCLAWRNFDHLSPVRHLLFNDTSSQLVSAGRRDIKVWDIDRHAMLWTAELAHDTMKVAISENGQFVTTTDKSNTFSSRFLLSGILEHSLEWGEKMPFPDEVGFRRPPLTAALSPDSLLIAIVYRGRPICIYDLKDDMLHGLVSREGNPASRGLGTMTSPASLVFNSKKDNSGLAVAYEDGDLCLFDYEDLNLIKTIEEADAHIVACSPDGLILLAGNSIGMVQLLEFDTLQLLYRVNAADYGIRGLAFSPDNLRFLDVRGTQCNVWEPALLLGLAKRDESSTEPAEWEPIIKGIDSGEVLVTSIELDHTGKCFFTGRSDGTLSVGNIITGEIGKVLYRHNFEISVAQMVWGPKRKILASSDTACRFIVCALLPDPGSGWKVASKLMDRRADSTILQLLLDADNGLLLVSTEISNSVWNIESRHLVSTEPLQSSKPFVWMNDMRYPDRRALITADAFTVFHWQSTQRLTSIPLDLSLSNQFPSSTRCVKGTFTFAEGSLMVTEFSQLYDARATTEVLISKRQLDEHGEEFFSAAPGFRHIQEQIKHVIGGYHSKLLFLDAARWVSSIDAKQTDWKFYIRHFPIPSDWRSQQRQLQTAITQNGDVLFVRTNEVAVISSGLDFEERVQLE